MFLIIVTLHTAKCILANPSSTCLLRTADTTCDNFPNYIECEMRHAMSVCGKASACFVYKFLSLQNCYYGTPCGLCPSFATTFVSNPVGDICSHDVEGNQYSTDTPIDKNNDENNDESSDAKIAFINLSLIALCFWLLF